ncbi:hypothetical protein BDR06DRAFT_1015270 [Suillus hirtellus]|nr:hypothetical protein BDR06DRAFT_1015270 [Suillus hirtellus]
MAQRTIAIFQRSSTLNCVTFSVDGGHIVSGLDEKKFPALLNRAYDNEDAIESHQHSALVDRLHLQRHLPSRKRSRPESEDSILQLLRLVERALTTDYRYCRVQNLPTTPINLATPHHATAPIVDAPFANAKERNVATGAPGNVPDIAPDEYLDTTQTGP